MNASRTYEKIAARLNWGANTRLFLLGLAALTPLMVVARVSSLATNILAGRWLGSAQYGLAGLTLATAKICLVPMSLGFLPAAARLAVVQEESRPSAVSTFVWSLFIWVGLCLLGGLWFRNSLSHWMKVSPAVYWWSALYAASQLSYTAFASLLLGLLKFKTRGFVELAYAVFILISVAFFSHARAQPDFRSFVEVMTIGCLMGSCFCLYALRGFLKPVFHFAALKDVFAYTGPYLSGWGVMIGAESLISLMISWHLTPQDLGYFSAYQTMMFRPALAASMLIGSVLGPSVSVPSRQKGAWKKFFRHIPVIFPLAFLIFFLVGTAMLRLMGSGYPLRFSWLILFAVAATIIVISSFPGAILNYRNASGAWLSSASSVFGAALCAGVGFWAIPRFGVAGGAAALISLYGGAFLWNSYCGWSLELKDRNERI